MPTPSHRLSQVILSQTSYTRCMIALSLLLALLLMLIPLPQSLVYFNIPWVLLVLIYWSMALPHRIGLMSTWCVGLFVDVINNAALGEHALVFSCIIFCVLKWHRQIRQFPLVQQSVYMGVFMLGYLTLLFFIQGFQGYLIYHWTYWLISPITVFVWPVIFLSLRRYRRGFRIG